MIPNAFISGADRGLGYELCAGLLAKGWAVYAGQYMPEWPALGVLGLAHPERLRIIPLDVNSDDSVRAAANLVHSTTSTLEMLINNAGVISPVMGQTIREAQDFGEVHRLYETNALGPIRLTEKLLPLLDQGALKRLCFISSEAGSIERCTRKSWFSYCMSKAALNMAVKIIFNDLRPQGYTFRLYHPGWMRTYMNGEKNPSADMEPEEAAAKALAFILGTLADEDVLAMTDYLGQAWPW